MDLEITGELSVFTILALGFVLGLKHAVEADHLAAVSTIVAERKNLLSSAIVGGFWGVGHTMSLLFMGAIVVFLKLQISRSVESMLETVVGAMLVVLGANALWKLSRKDEIHIHTHEHAGREHTHIHTHENEKKADSHHMARLTPRSLAIGMVHGLAGSAALMLLLVPTIVSPSLALLYIAVFGVGSIGGMMLMSVVIGLPFHLTAGKYTILNKGLFALAGVCSCSLGLFIVYQRLG